MTRLLFIQVTVLLLIYLTELNTLVRGSPCPNHCNSHGRCSDNQICECFEGFMGGDCSLRTCPEGHAWADKAIAVDNAHNIAECSNMGTCDRSTGTCSCNTGFDGQACDRKQCPSSCLNRGKCQSLLYYAQTKDPGDGMTQYPGSGTEIDKVYTYTGQWDSEKFFGCNCDANYYGPDCSLQKCPTGDDPLTTDQKNEEQTAFCTATGGTFTLAFRQETTAPINFDASSADLEAALESLQTITDVAVTVFSASSKACEQNGGKFVITFTQQFGDVPMLVSDASKLTTVAQSTADLSISQQIQGNKEDEYCSNRGLCDVTTGYCACSTNYKTSDGYGIEGIRGDCGYATATINVCPGLISCSGHGKCAGSPTFRCDCSAGWQGADCSERVCPKDMSWLTRPSANEEMHVYEMVECSDMGLCDRTTGRCTCMNGFTGSACHRLECPFTQYSCSGHGECYTMYDLAGLAEVNGELAGYTYGLTPNNPATWDAQHVQGCVCTEGYHGYDCSLLKCPTGDNPDSMGQIDEIQVVNCTATDAAIDNPQVGTNDATTAIKLAFEYKNEISTSVYSYATAVQVKAALEAMDGIREVSVESSTANGDTLCATSTGGFKVTFLTEHGDLPLLKLKSAISEDGTTRSATKVGSYEIQAGTKEENTCSDRGICDETTGKCMCFNGYAASDGKGGAGIYPDCGHIEKIIIDSGL